MATELILPRVDMDMAEGKIAYWYVKDGDQVTKGQVLFEIETDKATMEVDAPAAGIVAGLCGEIGEVMPVGQVVGWILAPGEGLPSAAEPPVEAAVAEGPLPAPASVSSPEPAPAPAAPPVVAADPVAAGAPLLRATPLARSLAREHGIELRSLIGSGPQGRIVGADVPVGAGGNRTSPLHLHWWQRGSGAPVVLLHGFGADHAGWRPLVSLLPPDMPLIGIDLPNHGKSGRLPVESLQDLADAVLRRLDQEGVDRFHLLGHSLGGGTALAAAALARDRVRSLTVLAPAGLGADIDGAFIDGLVSAQTESALRAVLLRLFHDPAVLSGSFVATAFQQLQAPGRQAALAALAARLMPAGRQAGSAGVAWPTLRVPIKVVWGRADRILPIAHAADLPGRVAVHLLHDVGHLPQVEAAGLVAELLQQQWRAAEAA
jgi:pyruvate dehydrogenase E2 component (dihydrolipoamide acetyltransferase)